MITVIVGLGNPGDKYAGTRHNVGAAFTVAVAKSFNIKIQPSKKYFGQLGKGRIGDHELSLLVPDTFMNESGKSVSAFLNFYRIDPSSMLVVHDDLDLPVGTARYKDGGGHGGHNGLRDIITCLGNENSFKRLRIGIDHPLNDVKGSLECGMKPIWYKNDGAEWPYDDIDVPSFEKWQDFESVLEQSY